MDFIKLKNELAKLYALAQRWNEQGYTPDIERDIAKERLRKLYTELCSDESRELPEPKLEILSHTGGEEKNITEEKKFAPEAENIEKNVIEEEEEIVIEAQKSENSVEETPIEDEKESENVKKDEFEVNILPQNEEKSEFEEHEEVINDTSEGEISEENIPAEEKTEPETVENDEQEEEITPEPQPTPEPEPQKLLKNDTIYIEQLFNGDEEYYQREAKKLLEMSSIDQIAIYIADTYTWSAQNQAADSLVSELFELKNQ